ncbi:MAG: alpha-galactosidase [Dehalococcoidia bacterium]|nr:alpha-galactosidase [Dehalococcoidia bacterium]
MYYSLDRLHLAHPDLIIEDCFNGDGHMDCGTRLYSTASWITDDSSQSWALMTTIQQQFYAVTYAFRPDYIIQWLASIKDTPVAIGRTTSLRDL